MPERRPLDLRTLDALTAEVAVLRSNGYDRVGQWSLEQILDHLTKTMTTGLDGAHGLPRPLRWLLRPVARRLLRTRSMPTMPAPRSIRPAADVDDGVHQRFAAIVARAATLTGDSVDHPAFGRMSVTDWQQLQLVHASRHLSFLIPRAVEPSTVADDSNTGRP